MSAPSTDDWAKVKFLASDVDGVLTDATVLYNAAGEWAKPFFIRDGMGLRLLEGAGVRVAVITSEDSPIVASRVKKLMLSGYWPGYKRKGELVKKLMSEFGVTPEETVYVGDDVNDLEAFDAAGISVAPNDGHRVNRERARFVTQSAGGRGCIREIADLILHAKGIDQKALWAKLHPDAVSRDSGTV